MTQFHVGQEVESYYPYSHSNEATWPWVKAKIVATLCNKDDPENDRYEVQFPDGTRAVFDAAHIRAVPNRDLAKMTPDELQEDVNDCYCNGPNP